MCQENPTRINFTEKYLKKNILYKIAFQDNEEVNAQYVEAQNVSIDQQAQKRDEYLSYQEDMNSKLNRNEQVCIFFIF